MHMWKSNVSKSFFVKRLAVASSGVFHSIKFVHFENYAAMRKRVSRINASVSETSASMFEKNTCRLDLLGWLLGKNKEKATLLAWSKSFGRPHLSSSFLEVAYLPIYPKFLIHLFPNCMILLLLALFHHVLTTIETHPNLQKCFF